MNAEEAREVVARHLTASAVKDALTGELVRWEDFPEIGEHDWAAIESRMRELAEPLTTGRERFLSAYAVLEARANRDQL